MIFERGDLVGGLKPWNNNTKVGVVIEKTTPGWRTDDIPTYRVFWVSNTGEEKSTFITWDVGASLVKLPLKKRLDSMGKGVYNESPCEKNDL